MSGAGRDDLVDSCIDLLAKGLGRCQVWSGEEGESVLVSYILKERRIVN